MYEGDVSNRFLDLADIGGQAKKHNFFSPAMATD